ncbi:hypothetical protein NLJ89_g9123 [Agrocybe chaxingu]|uniref:Uncharacterized protein n=1 Tax=Agrocybe chaxingu TaxID=84603 RepID=A0A9W8JU01_9AGAR|nr:hypothetical protein NLJ89_g9123 [Agrocybe chaxingu]
MANSNSSSSFASDRSAIGSPAPAPLSLRSIANALFFHVVATEHEKYYEWFNACPSAPWHLNETAQWASTAAEVKKKWSDHYAKITNGRDLCRDCASDPEILEAIEKSRPVVRPSSFFDPFGNDPFPNLPGNKVPLTHPEISNLWCGHSDLTMPLGPRKSPTPGLSTNWVAPGAFTSADMDALMADLPYQDGLGNKHDHITPEYFKSIIDSLDPLEGNMRELIRQDEEFHAKFT